MTGPTRLRVIDMTRFSSSVVLLMVLAMASPGNSTVRAAYPHENLIRSELVRDIDAARTLANQWRATVVSAGFVDLVETAARQ